MFFLSSPINQIIASTKYSDTVIEVEKSAIGVFLHWTRLISTGVAMIAITIMAFRYITAEGPNAKAELKKSFSSYIFGVVFMAAATNILYYVEQFVEYLVDKIA